MSDVFPAQIFLITASEKTHLRSLEVFVTVKPSLTEAAAAEAAEK